MHRTATFQELADLLSTYDMKRDLLELNFKAAQWTCGAVWNRWYMEPPLGKDLLQMWQDHETDIAKKVTSSQPVSYNDQRRAASAAANQPAACLPDSTFLHALGTPDIHTAPPQTGSLALRAREEWGRSIYETTLMAASDRPLVEPVAKTATRY